MEMSGHLFYVQGKNLRYPLDRSLDVPQSRPEHGGEDKKFFLALVGNRIPDVQRFVNNY